MNIKIFDKEKRKIETRKVVVDVSENIVFTISLNQFGELVIQKQNFGDGETSIVIKPSVSNEIRLT